MSTTFLKHFESITDPRINRCKKHNLLDILLLAVSAVLSGAQGWEDIEDFGRLKADEIEHVFQSWIYSLVKVTGCDVIDGKKARRSFTTKDRKNTLHTVSAWSFQHQLVLGQTAVNEKSNEITAIPELLSMVDIENSIITLDAMGCQKAIAEEIIKQKADYVLLLKGNHSRMRAELEAWWHKSQREGLSESSYDKHTEINAGHGRIETRIYHQLLANKSWLDKVNVIDGGITRFIRGLQINCFLKCIWADLSLIYQRCGS